jgi:hypothetical protein
MPNINDVSVTPNVPIISNVIKNWNEISLDADDSYTTNLKLTISLPSGYSFNSVEETTTIVNSPRNYWSSPDTKTIQIYQKNPSTWIYELVGDMIIHINWKH